MGTLNDFKLVKQISTKYFSKLNVEPKNEVNDTDKSRLGFYLFILSCVTDATDIEDVVSMIIDTDFQRKMYGKTNNDLGIDAVYIDEENHDIKLFNFKYREKFNEDKRQALNTVSDSSKFLNAVSTHTTDGLDELTKNAVQAIVDRYNSNDIWNTQLYLISNENQSLNLDVNEVKSFIVNNDVEIIPISLDDITEFISEKPDDRKATFVIDSDSVMTFKDDPMSSSQSYLVKLPLITLIRLTCKDEGLREDYAIEDYSQLSKVELDIGLLYDNVRGYLGNTKFNKNILKSIDSDPNRFFMFNNGITMTTNKVSAQKINGNHKLKCSLDGFQVVNGGQTLRTIYKYKDENFDEEKLSNSEILVRIFQTENDKTLTNNIAEYTNSQNAISAVDLKSISNVQIKIEEYLKEFDIAYIRKVDKSVNVSSESITMEVMAQLIYSRMGYPEIVTNQKGALFNRYYDEIFNDSLDFDELITLYRTYREIERYYKSISRESTKQMRYYIIWMMLNKGIKMDEAVKKLDRSLSTYKSDENLSDARKIIQKPFKDHLEKTIE
ncbi:TPA: AIPR family protein [Streptococcus suis]|uniref:AIPR family protein n=1 Tax=Streptococcus suis TaxID=1307 RepID=UPI0003F86FE2|nr:AIPR family protein [Streptococcus suis]HEL2377647.1 AIPR family protein [Streptococcus suis]HEL2693799.1 AIPR family protein [Streptococcus suis]HEM5274103.1 AIPR family protein [Streptococcus suis]